MTLRLFIFGAGYSAQAFARTIAGRAGAITGTTRLPGKFDALLQAGIEPLLFDGTRPSAEIASRLSGATHLVISVAPDKAGDPVLDAARTVIIQNMPALRWVGYLSTVGVYGDHQGAWVDEACKCHPVSQRSRERLAVENEWLAIGRNLSVPVAILRLSGIYGPDRNAFVNLANGTARRIVKPGQVFNRIHVGDVAGALVHLVEREKGGTFNITDDVPAPSQDVVAYAAGLMGIEPPPEIPIDRAKMSPMARSFYDETKRVSNSKIKESGYAFRFPNYRTAFDEMWTTGSWRSPAEATAVGGWDHNGMRSP
jgi:nucleoside-diphosphate-sugar epimerase